MIVAMSLDACSALEPENGRSPRLDQVVRLQVMASEVLRLYGE